MARGKSVAKDITTFRHTSKAIENIEAYKKKHDVNKSLAINQMLENFQESEQKQEMEKFKGDFFTLPPFLYCWRESNFYLRDNLLDPENDAGCHNSKTKCKKTCPAWKHQQMFVTATPR